LRLSASNIVSQAPSLLFHRPRFFVPSSAHFGNARDPVPVVSQTHFPSRTVVGESPLFSLISCLRIKVYNPIFQSLGVLAPLSCFRLSRNVLLLDPPFPPFGSPGRSVMLFRSGLTSTPMLLIMPFFLSSFRLLSSFAFRGCRNSDTSLDSPCLTPEGVWRRPHFSPVFDFLFFSFLTAIRFGQLPILRCEIFPRLLSGVKGTPEIPLSFPVNVSPSPLYSRTFTRPWWDGNRVLLNPPPILELFMLHRIHFSSGPSECLLGTFDESIWNLDSLCRAGSR